MLFQLRYYYNKSYYMNKMIEDLKNIRKEL